MVNPYAGLTGQWVRGSFHGHCSENSSCASVPLAESVRRYHEVGAGFVTLTDHDVVTDFESVAGDYPDLSFLPGFEYSTRENVVFVGPGIGPLYEIELEDALSLASEYLTIIAHPLRYGSLREYWTLPMVEALGAMPDGTEVYNGHYGIERALASGRWPLYTEFWDALLTAGHRLWGFANDEFHDPEDFGNAFNVVCVEKNTPDAIVRAAKRGQCYASTGLRLADVTEAGGEISVNVDAPGFGTFVGPGGETLSRSEGTSFTYRAEGEAYIRFEAEGEKGRLFLQPMFAE